MPLPLFGKPTQKTKQHDHGHSQHCRRARQTAPVIGGILRGAQHGLKPQAGQAIKTNITGQRLIHRFGQQQHVALAGAYFAPFNGIGQRIGARLVKHRPVRNAGPHIKQHGSGFYPLRQGGQGKAQPHDAGGARQSFHL